MRNYELEIYETLNDDGDDVVRFKQKNNYIDPDVIDIHKDQVKAVIECLESYIKNGEG